MTINFLKRCKLPAREVRMLLTHVTGNQNLIHQIDVTDISLNSDQIDQLQEYIDRREGGEPVAKIIGRKDFWKDTFITNEYTLDPRPDSEALIELALEILSDTSKPYKILDLGTGTGCLLLSLLRELPNASGLSIDKSEQALAVAKKNATNLGLDERINFLCCDWASALNEKFDLIVCNPPYIDESEDLDQQTLHDPHSALFAADNGLACYRELLKILKPIAAGPLIFELGAGQAECVKEIAIQNEWHYLGEKNDLGGHVRAMGFSIISV